MRKKILILIIAALIVGGLVFAAKGRLFQKQEKQAEIITESSLYKIIDVSELSTYQCVYNDICTVMAKDNADEVAYYCAYDAKVNAGIDVTQIEINVAETEDRKLITVTVPEVEVNDVNVDIASLDYMFELDDSNTETVSAEAYKACIADVTKKSEAEDKIYELAQQNAENIIKALVNPFIEQMNMGDIDYELKIVTAGEVAK